MDLITSSLPTPNSEEPVTPKPDAGQQELTELLDLRAHLIGMRIRLKHQIRHLRDTESINQSNELLKLIISQQKKLEDRIAEKVNSDAEMKRKAKRMEEVSGAAQKGQAMESRDHGHDASSAYTAERIVEKPEI